MEGVVFLFFFPSRQWEEPLVVVNKGKEVLTYADLGKNQRTSATLLDPPSLLPDEQVDSPGIPPPAAPSQLLFLPPRRLGSLSPYLCSDSSLCLQERDQYRLGTGEQKMVRGS